MFLSGFEAVACMQRSIRNLGKSAASRKGMPIQLFGGKADECQGTRILPRKITRRFTQLIELRG